MYNNFKCQSSHIPSGQFPSQQKNRKSLNALQASLPSQAPTNNLKLNQDKQIDSSAQGMYPPTAKQKNFHHEINQQINRTFGFSQPAHSLQRTKIPVDNPYIKISNSEPLPSDETIARLLTLPKIQLHTNTDQKSKEFKKTRASGVTSQSKEHSTKQKLQQQWRRTSVRGRLHAKVLQERKVETGCDQLLPNRLLTCNSIGTIRSTLNRTRENRCSTEDSNQYFSQLEPAGRFKQPPKIKIKQKKQRKKNLNQKLMDSLLTKYGNSFFQEDQYELEPWSTKEEDELNPMAERTKMNY